MRSKATPSSKEITHADVVSCPASTNSLGLKQNNKASSRRSGGSPIVTPIVQVELTFGWALAKLEKFNDSRSHKDRSGRLIAQSFRRTRRPGTQRRYLVSSSGNFATAIAYHTQEDEVEVIVITDVLSPRGFVDGLKAYPHVRVIVVNEPDATGSHVDARLKMIERLMQENPDSINIDQYNDRRLPIAYEETLAPEIDAQLGNDAGSVFLPAGTGATLHGLLNYKRKYGRRWRVFAVDAEGSNLFRPPQGAKRRLPGYGNAKPTGLIRELNDEPFHVVHVTDHEAIAMCHRLWQKGRLFVGPSSGATMAAIEKVLVRRPDLIPDYGYPVAILPDGGEHYVTTVFNDDWLIENGFGQIVSARI